MPLRPPATVVDGRVRISHEIRHELRVVDVVGVQQLVDGDPGEVAVHRRHPLQRPTLGVAGDQLVDPVEVRGHALDQADRVVELDRPGRLDATERRLQYLGDR